MGNRQRAYTVGMTWALVLAALYLTSLYSYLLFHTLAEVFSAAVALAIFMLVWNVRRSMDNAYLLFVGVAYLFIGGLDLVHTLAYKGMGVFKDYDADLPTQLWVGARYLQSLSLLVAPLFVGRQLNVKAALAVYAAAVSLLLGSIFYWDVFPTCFVAGKGLTPFKQISEYAIGVILLLSIAMLLRKRNLFEPAVLLLIVSSITLTVLSEMCFSAYVDVYGSASLLGHLLKVTAFYCIYRAIIETGIAKPFAVLFRNLKESEESLKKAHDELERRVEDRTAELVKANELLARQVEERKQAENVLKRERQKLRDILEKMNDGVYIVNQRYGIEYVNPVIEREFGQVNGRKCYEYFHDRTEVCPWCRNQEVFAGRSVQWEWYSSKTGKTYDLFDTPIPNEDGTLSKLEIFHDVTWRKKSEEAIRESEMKYRIVADHTSDWEWWRDPEGKFIYVSPSCKEITHHSPEEFESDPELLSKLIHPDDMSSFVRHMTEVEETNSAGEMEFRILRPDGSIRWIAHACQPVLDEQGRRLGRRGNNRDTTERKEAERALRASEERYRTLVETMNEGLGVVDEKDVWTYVNEKLCNMLGYSHDEIVGRPVREWLDETNERILTEQALKRRKGEHKPYELAWVRKDGSTLYTIISPKPLLSEAGEFQGSFAVITDITQRKKAEESLQNALHEIKALKERLEAENIYFREEVKMKHQFDHIIGQSNAFKYVLYRAEQVAPRNTTVLILGETGTGKELIASAIHQMSHRRDRPLITVNCAALPANLIESELFGREKGAFTGSDTRQLGRFDMADGSTLCLDEIGELPLEVQAKLLRVIQHSEFERLGSSRTIKVDVRIVATTNRNLEEEVRKGRFRQDLYYRLNVFPLTVPPLRQRKDDIPLLVQVFTERYARELGKEITAIPKETMKVLQDYEWPGNVRELENVIERAAILCSDSVLQLAEKLENPTVSPSLPLRTLEEMEREQILKTLSETRWRINGEKGAAAILGLHPSTLRARMQKLGIRRPEI